MLGCRRWRGKENVDAGLRSGGMPSVGGAGGGAPYRDSEQIVAAICQEAGIVTVMRALPYFLLARLLAFAQLRFGNRVEETFVLVTGLFSANAQGDTRNHPAPFDLETWTSQGDPGDSGRMGR